MRIIFLSLCMLGTIQQLSCAAYDSAAKWRANMAHVGLQSPAPLPKLTQGLVFKGYQSMRGPTPDYRLAQAALQLQIPQASLPAIPSSPSSAATVPLLSSPPYGAIAMPAPQSSPAANSVDQLQVPSVEAVKKLFGARAVSFIWIYDELVPSPAPTQEKALAEYNTNKIATINKIRAMNTGAVYLKELFPKLNSAQQEEWRKITRNGRYTLWHARLNKDDILRVSNFPPYMPDAIDAFVCKHSKK